MSTNHPANIDVAAALAEAQELYRARNPKSLAQYQEACAAMPGGNTRTGISAAEWNPDAIKANAGTVKVDTKADVAKVTVFVTDIADFPVVNAAYGAAVGDHRPARSTVQVAALPAGAKVEIEVWAHKPV